MTKSKGEVVVGVHEAKTNLSRLLERVAAGDDIVITNRGQVVARIVADGSSLPKRMLGTAAGQVRIDPTFDDPLPSELMAFFE